MKLHNFTKLVESYKNIKQTIKKETRKAYKENNICYNENLEVDVTLIKQMECCPL